jgi:hypothetical protein
VKVRVSLFSSKWPIELEKRIMPHQKGPLAAVLAALIMLTSLTSCETTPYAVSYSNYGSDDYYFYPTARVYFHPWSGYYYYADGSRWIRTQTLPEVAFIYGNERVLVRVSGHPPYYYYDRHRKRYGHGHGHRRHHGENRRERDRNRELYLRVRPR